MKSIILFSALVFFSFNFAAAQSAKPDSTATKQNPPTARDYNYEFVTAGNYTVLSIAYKLDSLPGGGLGYKELSDTSTTRLQVLVRKQGAKLTIASIDPTSTAPPFYSQTVQFKGGTNELIYQAQTIQDGKTQTVNSVVVNPAAGYIAVLFRTCEQGLPCRVVNHYFGGIEIVKP